MKCKIPSRCFPSAVRGRVLLHERLQPIDIDRLSGPERAVNASGHRVGHYSIRRQQTSRTSGCIRRQRNRRRRRASPRNANPRPEPGA